MTIKNQASIWMDSIVSKYVAPILKNEGFKKRGRTFFKESEDIIKVLEIQSGWNLPEKANFTINLRFIFPDVWEVITGSPKPDNPIRIHPTVNQRIGLLMPCPIDMWWSLKKDTDIETIGPKVTSAIIDYALPFLNKAASSGDLIALYAQNSESWGINHLARLHAAIIANHLGDNRYARSLLLEQLNVMSATIKVVETSVRTDGTSASKEKDISNAESINFVCQCAERMGIDLQHPTPA